MYEFLGINDNNKILGAHYDWLLRCVSCGQAPRRYNNNEFIFLRHTAPNENTGVALTALSTSEWR